MTVTGPVVKTIQQFAREAYPHECCGALIGEDGAVTEAMAIPNTTDEGARRRFRISPEDYLRVEKHVRTAQKELLGFYHSHPNHPARPSQYDLDHAWPNLLYLIISVSSERSGDMTAWTLAEDRSRFEQLEVAVV